MRHLTLLYFLCFFIAGIITVVPSCTPYKKVGTTKKDLKTINDSLERQQKNLRDLEAQRKKKVGENQIDDTASSRIQVFINNTTNEIVKIVNENTLLIGDIEVNRKDWNKLQKALTFSRSSSKKIGDKVLLLNDLINRNMVVRIDQDVVFEPGKYTVSPTVASSLGKLFEPVAKEIDQFVLKYPDFPLSLVITAKGYADGTAIVEGTPLYSSLKDRLKLQTNNPDAKELNKELSRARAEAVITLFKQYTFDRSKGGGSVRNILYLYEGKGDAPPDPKVKDYSMDDPRRRVVFLFWSLFPD
jgi:flagellar motor protein MotB